MDELIVLFDLGAVTEVTHASTTEGVFDGGPEPNCYWSEDP